jgi:hypothetical protein
MTTFTALPQPILPRIQAPLRHVLAAWRSLQTKEAACFLLLGAVLAGMNLLALTDPSSAMRGGPDRRLSQALAPMLGCFLSMLIWLPADRSATDSRWRVHRLATAVVLASIASATLVPLVIHWLGLPNRYDAAGYIAKGKLPPSTFAVFASYVLAHVVLHGLVVSALEFAARRRRSEQALHAALGEHARLARAALESRLAAMQAQVEPRFLFDVLVDIERLYRESGADRSGAAAQMERLITYLRVALPKLRDSGSTLGAEFALVASYLDLVQAMRAGRPRLHTELPPALADTLFHPMLLLPLVQRALRDPLLTPERIDLTAQATKSGLQLQMAITAPRQCRDDAELARLRERLQILYEGRAVLRCEEREPATPGAATCSVFTLELPA